MLINEEEIRVMRQRQCGRKRKSVVDRRGLVRKEEDEKKCVRCGVMRQRKYGEKRKNVAERGELVRKEEIVEKLEGMWRKK